MNEKEFNADVKEFKELQTMYKEIETEMMAIRDRIITAMLACDKDEVFTPEYKVTYKPVTQLRFDSKTFKEAYGKLYDSYCKSSTYNRLSVF